MSTEQDNESSAESSVAISNEGDANMGHVAGKNVKIKNIYKHKHIHKYYLGSSMSPTVESTVLKYYEEVPPRDDFPKSLTLGNKPLEGTEPVPIILGITLFQGEMANWLRFSIRTQTYSLFTTELPIVNEGEFNFVVQSLTSQIQGYRLQYPYSIDTKHCTGTARLTISSTNYEHILIVAEWGTSDRMVSTGEQVLISKNVAKKVAEYLIDSWEPTSTGQIVDGFGPIEPVK